MYRYKAKGGVSSGAAPVQYSRSAGFQSPDFSLRNAINIRGHLTLLSRSLIMQLEAYIYF